MRPVIKLHIEPKEVRQSGYTIPEYIEILEEQALDAISLFMCTDRMPRKSFQFDWTEIKADNEVKEYIFTASVKGLRNPKRSRKK